MSMYSGKPTNNTKVNEIYGSVNNANSEYMYKRALDLMEILDKKKINYSELETKFFDLWDKKEFSKLHYILDQLAKLVDKNS